LFFGNKQVNLKLTWCVKNANQIKNKSLAIHAVQKSRTLALDGIATAAYK